MEINIFEPRDDDIVMLLQPHFLRLYFPKGGPVPEEVDSCARHDQGVGGKDDHFGGVLEQAGRKCWGAQFMGGHKGMKCTPKGGQHG